jgi:hypothetical protein
MNKGPGAIACPWVFQWFHPKREVPTRFYRTWSKPSSGKEPLSSWSNLFYKIFELYGYQQIGGEENKGLTRYEISVVLNMILQNFLILFPHLGISFEGLYVHVNS